MSDCYFRKELSEMNITIPFEKIYDKMHELEKIIDYEFKDINNLANAMCAINLGNKKNNPDYYASALATVGDAVIKTILADELYKAGFDKGIITQEKSNIEKTKFFVDNFVNPMGIFNFGYNEKWFYPEVVNNKQLQHEQVAHPKHDFYFEAIVGAIYYDRGFVACKQWLLDHYFGKIIEEIKNNHQEN